MDLSEPAERELLHERDIAIRGYRRSDGLFDIEAEITDRKTYGFMLGNRGHLAPGDKLHNMVLRMTVDTSLTIVACEAVMRNGPFAAGPGGATTCGRLAGLSIRSGFLREANARIGGIEGCTHIRELLQQMATVAVQTSFILPARQKDDAAGASRLINTCHAYAASGEVVKHRWPDAYTGAEKTAEPAD